MTSALLRLPLSLPLLLPLLLPLSHAHEVSVFGYDTLSDVLLHHGSGSEATLTMVSTLAPPPRYVSVDRSSDPGWVIQRRDGPQEMEEDGGVRDWIGPRQRTRVTSGYTLPERVWPLFPPGPARGDTGQVTDSGHPPPGDGLSAHRSDMSSGPSGDVTSYVTPLSAGDATLDYVTTGPGAVVNGSLLEGIVRDTLTSSFEEMLRNLNTTEVTETAVRATEVTEVTETATETAIEAPFEAGTELVPEDQLATASTIAGPVDSEQPLGPCSNCDDDIQWTPLLLPGSDGPSPGPGPSSGPSPGPGAGLVHNPGTGVRPSLDPVSGLGPGPSPDLGHGQGGSVSQTNVPLDLGTGDSQWLVFGEASETPPITSDSDLSAESSHDSLGAPPGFASVDYESAFSSDSGPVLLAEGHSDHLYRHEDQLAAESQRVGFRDRMFGLWHGMMRRVRRRLFPSWRYLTTWRRPWFCGPRRKNKKKKKKHRGHKHHRRPRPSYGAPKAKPKPSYGPPKSKPKPSYGPPKSKPKPSYGPPKSKPKPSYGPPKSKPKPSYGPPKAKPKPSYGAPKAEPKPSYRPPKAKPKPSYSAPKAKPQPSYGPPKAKPKPSYSAPKAKPKPSYTAPKAKPKPSYEAPKPKPSYGPPTAKPKPSYAAPKAKPKPSYGPPKAKPKPSYGTPKAKPKPSYGPPQVKPKPSYGAPQAKPKPTYGAPKAKPNLSYGPPKAKPKPSYGAPQGKPKPTYGAPKAKPNLSYGPPKAKPRPSYGAPQGRPKPTYGAPKAKPNLSYGPPKAKPKPSYGAPQAKPKPTYGAPKAKPKPQYGPPKAKPKPSYGPPSKRPSQMYGPPYHTQILPSQMPSNHRAGAHLFGSPRAQQGFPGSFSPETSSFGSLDEASLDIHTLDPVTNVDYSEEPKSRPDGTHQPHRPYGPHGPHEPHGPIGLHRPHGPRRPHRPHGDGDSPGDSASRFPSFDWLSAPFRVMYDSLPRLSLPAVTWPRLRLPLLPSPLRRYGGSGEGRGHLLQYTDGEVPGYAAPALLQHRSGLPDGGGFGRSPAVEGLLSALVVLPFAAFALQRGAAFGELIGNSTAKLWVVDALSREGGGHLVQEAGSRLLHELETLTDRCPGMDQTDITGATDNEQQGEPDQADNDAGAVHEGPGEASADQQRALSSCPTNSSAVVRLVGSYRALSGVTAALPSDLRCRRVKLCQLVKERLQRPADVAAALAVL